MYSKNLIISLSCIFMCICASFLVVLYVLAPKMEINKKTKEYYITASIDYFKENIDMSKVTIDTLIKTGYAEYIDDLKYSSCKRKESDIIKNGNKYEITFYCDGYKTNYAVFANKEL